MKNFTQEEIERMRDYEKNRGQRIIYSFEERCDIYRTKNKSDLERAAAGIRNAVNARLNLDNEDIFDGKDDGWKLKVLQENLRAIDLVLAD